MNTSENLGGDEDWKTGVDAFISSGQPLEINVLIECGQNPGILQLHLDEVKSRFEPTGDQPETISRFRKLASFAVKAIDIHTANARYYPSSSIPHRGVVGSPTMIRTPSPQE